MVEPRGGARLLALLALALTGSLLTGACSSSSAGGASGGSCGNDPPQCPAGTTCWPATASAELECLPSNPSGTFGVACNQNIGTATCADGLACDQVGPGAGMCTYYCGDPGKGCPPGYECHGTHVGASSGPTIEICRPAGDGGTVEPSDADTADDCLGLPTGPVGPSDSAPPQQ